MSAPRPWTYSFGKFRLLPDERCVLKEGARVRLGSRAYDVLLMLIEHAGQVVSKEDLVARVWPNTFVAENNLKVHVAALRRALGDDRSGDRFVVSVPRRGYCFVAPVTRLFAGQNPHPTVSAREPPAPSRPMPRVIGRADNVKTMAQLMLRERLTTIVGPGGIGKTTVTLPAAEASRAAFPDGVRFIDLAAVTNPGHVSSALAAALGVEVRSEGLNAGLVAHLREKRMLLVFDSCEHVIGAAANLVEDLLKGTENTHVVATSREALRTTAEQVYRLAPLATPPSSENLTAIEAIAFPAVELFVERAATVVDSYQLHDREASLAADICRRLDGNPLAIELAAGCMEVLGIADIAASLDDRFGLLTRGPRSAVPRQQTLRSTLDWSHDLLADAERTLFRRLAVFVGSMAMDAAVFVAGAESTPSEVIELLGNLVAKSMVGVEPNSIAVRYRLLDTMRAYAVDKMRDSGEFQIVRRRHAEYFKSHFERAKAEHERLETKEWRALFVPEIGNVRAALEWAFSPDGDVAIALPLAAAAATLFLEMSLLSECQFWAETALARLGAVGRHTREELELRATLGVTFSFTKGNGPELRTALGGALQVAESLEDAPYQFRLLYSLYMSYLRAAEFEASLAVAKRAEALSRTSPGQAFSQSVDWMLGDVNHFLGNHAEARARSMAAARHSGTSRRASTVRSGIDPRVHGNLILARTLWLQGFPDQAAAESKKTMDIAEASEHPVTICLGLTWMTPLLIFMGDLETAAHYLARLERDADKHRLATYQAVALGLRGEILLRNGNAERSVALLRSSIGRFRELDHRMVIVPLLGVLAEALMNTGNFNDGSTVIDEAIATAEATKELLHFPELLRIKGEIVKASNPHSLAGREQAEELFLRAMHSAGRLSALSWELRAATSLAELRRASGRDGDAHLVLAATYGKFVEGFGTTDLRRARCILDELEARLF